MELSLHHPTDGFYRGTRFDHSGIFSSLLLDGEELCGPWFETYHPDAHDAVQGPSEEFSPIPVTENTLLKIGVGLLEADSASYDRFRLYPVAEAGTWEVLPGAAAVTFRHILPGFYTYTKEIVLTGASSFDIRHCLCAERPLEGEVYNHNFFTLNRLETGPGRTVDFPFRPAGDWRAVYDSVAFTSAGIRFSRPLQAGESVYCGNIHASGEQGMPYAITLGDGPVSVRISASVPASRTVFWANHRIACPEPYNRFLSRPGEAYRWTISYILDRK